VINCLLYILIKQYKDRKLKNWYHVNFATFINVKGGFFMDYIYEYNFDTL